MVHTLWLPPLLWVSLFVLAPDLPYNLVLAIITAIGLILPYRKFVRRPEKESSRVK